MKNYFQLGCCGARGPKDWIEVLNSTILPISCCQNRTTQISNCTAENAMKNGCEIALVKHLDTLCVRLAGVGFGIGWIQVCENKFLFIA